MPAVGERDVKPDGRNLRRDLLDKLGEGGIEEQRLIFGVVGDIDQLIEEQPRVQRVIDPADAGDAVPRLDMTRGVPRHRGDAVAQGEAGTVERMRHPASAAAGLAIIGADDRAFRTAAHDLPVAVIERRVIDDLVDQQRPVLHQPQHVFAPFVFTIIGNPYEFRQAAD